jgi:uncharacterized protein YbjT (DUF2867 family)
MGERHLNRGDETMSNRTIAVLGATGGQGGGVVDALLSGETFRVRAVVRDPATDAANALARRGVDLVQADLLDPGSLRRAFEGAHGAFVVTNFWDAAQMGKETAIATAAVEAARASGVHHLVWSTLPDCETISGGRFHVAHFTDKARVDPIVAGAGFRWHTFVRPPMYFQNFLMMARPQPLPSGGRGWAVPMDPAARVIHAGDVSEVGRAVSAAFTRPQVAGGGAYFDVCGGTYSWNDFVSTLNAQGHDLQVVRVPGEAFDKFFEAARELRVMYEYYEKYTYFGPGHEARIAAANALVPGGFTGFADWARRRMKAH